MISVEEILEINDKCPFNQGIFLKPYGISTNIKEYVIYCRYTNDVPKNKMKVLDIVLMKLCPNISYLQYRQIEQLINYNECLEPEYYGNSTIWKIEFIKLFDLYELLKKF